MTKKILAEMDFASIVSQSYAQTQTGAELLNKYKAHVMSNETSCALVNGFVREASKHRYDNGVNEALTVVADYITQNKTAWALTTACESINANNSSHNYINRNAAKHVEKLLEMEENDIVKYIKAGALKNVMFCEAFRNIAKQVFKDTPELAKKVAKGNKWGFISYSMIAILTVLASLVAKKVKDASNKEFPSQINKGTKVRKEVEHHQG
jgi:hypothetical protein